MHSVSLIAPGKINLDLEIIGDRPDGYHSLIMILQSIKLADKILLHPNGTDLLRVTCHHREVPSNQDNLAYKAAALMQKEFPSLGANYGGLDIIIEKHLPVAAGLAGGSADAAAVLVGINLMWDLGLTQPEIEELAAKFGSDIPFCVGGGTAIATGRGEKLDSITPLDHLWLVLAKYRSITVSTPWAYKTYRSVFGHTYINEPASLASPTAHIHSRPLVKAIQQKNAAEIGKLLHNDLEKVVLPEFPKINQLRETCQNAGGLGTMMSGSGPSVFTLCASETEAEAIQQQVRAKIPDPDLELWVTQLCSHGIQVISHPKH
ncbi:MAG: 4-(cytidine 5'-diphospho)-2-C-methyl-D-erythritol kinase [Gomphosphaeria aponina SAG 52.96 = DSM 107014]|uniref:4-diphosphocytidyl-2-C-methyl-D-erythritol kinase n=1 Tax=Gomphosphaeria aponina SAG 52.96 = DSM 107014 TaxID=1521640 RepID=A0A941GT52_9CHRO|nr:4-(cytidine 5'-diphospho)-2-C-methyl-D-erythritol kinase [Gomphosphaeria aponina SAG 52.96 = DSM 107014]